jgi:hypothetical protein
MSENKVESQVDNSTVATEAPVETAVAPEATTENQPNRPEQTPLTEMLSEELREIEALKNYDSVDSMAKSLLSAQKMVGKRVEDLSKEDLVAVNKKFGVPDSIEGYEFEAEEAFKQEALDIGLNHEQARRLFEKQVALQETIAKEQELAFKDAEAQAVSSLEKEFGSQFEARMDLARKTARELGGEDLEKGVFDIQGGFDPKIIKALSEAGKRLFDHESVAVNQATKFGLTPSEAENEIKLLKSNPEFRAAYEDRDPSVRNAAAKKLEKLYKIAYPD